MENITVCERLVASNIMNSIIMLAPIMFLQHELMPVLFMQGYTHSASNHVPEHGSYQGACVHWEYRV
jgi:hypothetical protein